jgi:hypothetical protein
MSDGKLSVGFFEVGIVLTLVSMVLGPFEITSWAIAAAAVACFVALAGMYLAFSSWNEPDELELPPTTENQQEPQTIEE